MGSPWSNWFTLKISDQSHEHSTRTCYRLHQYQKLIVHEDNIRQLNRYCPWFWYDGVATSWIEMKSRQTHQNTNQPADPQIHQPKIMMSSSNLWNDSCECRQGHSVVWCFAFRLHHQQPVTLKGSQYILSQQSCAKLANIAVAIF